MPWAMPTSCTCSRPKRGCSLVNSNHRDHSFANKIVPTTFQWTIYRCVPSAVCCGRFLAPWLKPFTLRNVTLGTLAISGLPSITSGGGDGYIIKLSGSGAPIWATAASGPGTNRNLHITTLPDGTSFVAVGCSIVLAYVLTLCGSRYESLHVVWWLTRGYWTVVQA